MAFSEHLNVYIRLDFGVINKWTAFNGLNGQYRDYISETD